MQSQAGGTGPSPIMRNMPTGADLFVRTLQQLEINRIFTLVGDHLNEVLAAAARAGIDLVDMRHESGVTHAADAYARITRKPALSLVTGGPGHTNSLTGLATAHLAASPLIAVSGSRANSVADRQGFQDIDQLGMARPVVKWAAQPPSAAQIPFYLRRAYQEANTGRKGPVHLTIPVDVFGADVAAPPADLPLPRDPEPALPSPVAIAETVELLQAAKRPVVIAGSGAWWADAGPDLQQFIEATQLPLFTITMARGLVRDDHPLNFGYADPALDRASHQAFQQADLFLIFGKRIDFRLGLGGPRVLPAAAKCIQVDIHPPEFGLNRAIDVAIHSDVKQTLRALTTEIAGPLETGSWLTQLREFRQRWTSELASIAAGRSSPMHPAAFFTELKHTLPPGALLSWDGGDFTHWGRTLTPALEPGGWLRLGGLAAIGASLPNAIALKIAHPDRPVIAITGDGAFGFYLAELDTAVRYRLPIVIIVGNDAGWGLERELQQGQGTLDSASRTVACELRATRYDIIMKGFGGDGETIHSLDQLAPAMQRALASAVPYCINAEIKGIRSPFTEWQLLGKKRPTA